MENNGNQHENGVALSRKPRNIKTHNHRLVLSLLQRHERLTISEISASIDLSKTSVIKAVNGLVRMGVAQNAGKGSSTFEGGKRPDLFCLHAQYRYVIAADFGSSMLDCALLDLRGAARHRITKPYRDRADYAKSIEDLGAMVRALLREAGLAPAQLAGIAVGCEGIVDAENGVIRFPVHAPWGRDLPVRSDLAGVLSFPVEIYVDNLCRFAAYGELWAHPAYADEKVVTISTENSTGGCVLEHGQIQHGANGFLGEVGHIVVEPASPLACTCGNKGCFETVVSPAALLARAAEAAERPGWQLVEKYKSGALIPADIFAAACAGDALAEEIMDGVARYFAVLVRNIILLCDPQRIILQGMYIDAGDYFLQRIRHRVGNLPFYNIRRSLSIEYSAMGHAQGFFVGAAYYAANALFGGEGFFAV